MSRGENTKYFMHNYVAMEGRREIPKSSVVGVETPTLTIEISERDGVIKLQGDDCFAIVPESGNSVSLKSLDDRTSPTNVESFFDSEGDRRDASRALDELNTISSQLTYAKFTAKAEDRQHAANKMHELLAIVRKVL